MTVTFNVEITYRIRCSRCDNEASNTVVFVTGVPVPQPCIPSGWHVYDNQVICDKHKVQIK